MVRILYTSIDIFGTFNEVQIKKPFENKEFLTCVRQFYQVGLGVTHQNKPKPQKTKKVIENKDSEQILYWNTVGKELERLAEILGKVKNYPP